MSVTWTEIRDHQSGDFSSMSQSVIEAAISDAEDCLEEDCFGDKYDLAVKYLAMHELYLDSKGGGGSGVLASATAGPLSKSFRTNSFGDTSYYGSSRYGQKVLQLIRRCVGVWVV
jgi:hypothetical protein